MIEKPNTLIVKGKIEVLSMTFEVDLLVHPKFDSGVEYDTAISAPCGPSHPADIP